MSLEKCLGRRRVSNHGAPLTWRDPCANIKTNPCPNCGVPLCNACQKDNNRHKCSEEK